MVEKSHRERIIQGLQEGGRKLGQASDEFKSAQEGMVELRRVAASIQKHLISGTRLANEAATVYDTVLGGSGVTEADTVVLGCSETIERAMGMRAALLAISPFLDINPEHVAKSVPDVLEAAANFQNNHL